MAGRGGTLSLLLQAALASALLPVSVHFPLVRPLCKMSEHLEGKWVLDEGRHNKSAPCCGNDPSYERYYSDDPHWMEDPLHCGSIRQRKGKWFEVSGSSKFLNHVHGAACACAEIGFRDNYSWVPSNCELVEWNATRFCNRLGQRKLLILGDSTMEQTAGAFMNRVHWEFWSNHSAGCQTQITFAYSSTLLNSEDSKTVNIKPNGDPGKGNWSEIVRALDPDIVVLSTGAHINKFDKLHSTHLAEAEKNTESFQRIINMVHNDHLREFPDKKLVWKTQSPAGCKKDGSIAVTEDEYLALSSKKLYNWRNFPFWDKLAKKRFTGPNQFILDLHPLYFRTDAHMGSAAVGFTIPGNPKDHRWNKLKDCLHPCVPGPLEMFGDLLLQLMEVDGL